MVAVADAVLFAHLTDLIGEVDCVDAQGQPVQINNHVAYIQQIRIMLTQLGNQTRGTPIQSDTALTIVSLSKRGTCTSAWINKRNKQLNDDTGTDLGLSRDDIKGFWTRLGSKITMSEADWETHFGNLSQAANAGSVAIKTIVAQACCAGFTHLTSVVAATAAFADFPLQAWWAICGEDPTQAPLVLRGRPWAGIAFGAGNIGTPTSGAVSLSGASVRFKENLYLVKKLYKEVRGDKSLEDYTTAERSPMFKIEADQWVNAYIAAAPAYPGVGVQLGWAKF